MIPRVSPPPTKLKITPSKPKTKAVTAQPSVNKSFQIYLPEIGRGAEGGAAMFSLGTDEDVIFSSIACNGPPQFLQLD
jgi:hypothetical protein